MHPNSIITRSALDDSVLHSLKLDPDMQQNYGAPWLHISRTTLHKTLTDEASRLGVEFRLGCKVVEIELEQDEVGRPAVRIEGGEFIKGDIVVGADGIHSVCREQILGGKEKGVTSSGDMVYRFTLHSSLLTSHQEATIRELATEINFNYWAGPNGHAVGYLIESGEKFNTVISASDNLDGGFEKGLGNVEEMRERFKGWKARSLMGLLEMVEEVSVWRLYCGKELSTWRGGVNEGRVVLVGDAAHAMLPYL